MKQLGIALTLIFFACWFGQSTAQLCDCRNTTCRSLAMQDNPNTQICCNLTPQPVDTNPNSLNDLNGTPLGFQLLEYRGVDSNANHDLCTRVSFSTTLRNGRIAYVVAAVQSDSQICIRKRNPGPDDEPTCGSGGVFFCESYTSGSNVELEFLCNGNVNQGSCPVDDPTFYVRTNVTLLDTDDEDFCDNINRTLPNSLVQNLVTQSVNANPSTVFDGGALSVVSLLQPALLLVSLLLATLLLLH